MNKIFLALRCSFGALFLLFLTACAPATKIAVPVKPTASTQTRPAKTATPTVTLAPSGTPTPLITTPTITPIPSVLPKFPLDGYLFIFKKDENLYFQDGENTPVELAHLGKQKYSTHFVAPMLSDDNQKIVFSEADDNIYSINPDGTQKQMLIPKNWPASIEAGTFMYEHFLSFVPRTHLVAVEALSCKDKSYVSLCSATIFLADADTGKITKLANLGIAAQRDGILNKNIQFSPDGKMLAVGYPEGIKIFSLDGKIIHQDILPYTPSTSEEPFPALFWLPDSSGLFAALPDKLLDFNMGDFISYTLWRYSLADNATVPVPLDPPIAGNRFEVSPDGNWLAYYSGPSTPYNIYLGNLASGKTKFFKYAPTLGIFQWTLDSQYFMYGFGQIASRDEDLAYQLQAYSWLDDNHFVTSRAIPFAPGEHGEYPHEQSLIGEIKGNGIYYYETEFIDFALKLIKPRR